MKKMVEKAEEHTIISIHNHPNSTVPSLNDINTAWKKKYKYGIIVCHNGNIYKYKVLGEYEEPIVDAYLDRANKLIYNKDTVKDYVKQLSEIIFKLKENNVELEVLAWK